LFSRREVISPKATTTLTRRFTVHLATIYGGTRKTTSAFSKRNNKGKIWKQKAPNSPFQYKDKKPPVSAFKRWAESKGLNPYAVRESVYRQGIPATKFFSTPFKLGFNRLPPDLLDAFKIDPTDLQ
jgi:hypothetical protein